MASKQEFESLLNKLEEEKQAAQQEYAGLKESTVREKEALIKEYEERIASEKQNEKVSFLRNPFVYIYIYMLCVRGGGENEATADSLHLTQTRAKKASKHSTFY